MIHFRFRFFLYSTLPLLAACTLDTNAPAANLDVPAGFRTAQDSAAPVWPDATWWKGFHSPQLNTLVEQAIANNQDLAAAVARIRQADAQLRIAGAPLLPSLDATAGGGWRQSVNPRGGSPVEARSYNVGLNVSYQLDFWGSNRAAVEAAQAGALASRFDQQTVAITVVSGVTSTWLSACALQDRLDVARQNLADAERVLAAVRARVSVGTATALDLSQQETLVATQRNVIPGLQSQLEQQLIGLGILTGQPPQNITLRPVSLHSLTMPAVAAGLPSELLQRRPDIAAAEARLAAQNANIRIARAAFFPQIALTASGGWESTALNNLINPSHLVASIAGSLVQSIFDGGQRAGQLELERGRYDELLANYRNTVLQGFTDVENALIALRYAVEQERLINQSVALARRSATIARAQMEAGTVDIITVLTIQQSLFNNLDQLAQVRQTRALALVNLYKALGGGWHAPDAQTTGRPAGSTR